MFGLTKKGKFWKAISKDDIDGLKTVFNKKFITFTKNELNPVQYAAKFGSLNCLDELIKQGGEFEQTDNNQQTPLILATLGNKINVVEFLVNRNVNIEFRDKTGKNALSWALINSYFNIVKLLLKHGADINSQRNGVSNLMIMVDEQNIESAKFLLENKADLEKTNKNGRTALFYSMNRRNGNLDIVKLLIEYGANVNSEDNNGDSPLMLAAQNNFIEIVEFLINNGADINHESKGGQTALVLSESLKYKQMSKLLKNAGAKKDLQNYQDEKIIKDTFKQFGF